MPKKCIKFISGFLIPSLDNNTFGERLKWVDKREKKFQMYWFHKGGPKWTEQEAAVFVQWDKHKGHFQPHNKKYFTNSKQRFRALLYKLTQEGHLKQLKSDHKFIKMFCIGEGKKKKREKSNDSSSDAEYELYNEDETSSEEKDESSDELLRRVSEDNAINVLEDHSYSSADNSQNEDNIMDINRNHGIMDNMHYFTSEFEKMGLVKRNYDCEYISKITPPMTINDLLETLHTPDVFWSGVENTILTTRFSGIHQEDPYLISVSQNKTSFGNNLDEFLIHTSNSNSESFELSKVISDINFSVPLKLEMDHN